jgi:alkanesulfonate monooxygenase SsuD/methylene tetrahydromethanopterin reductase-like flavin-dependent oxidoreductase (luciferase family)
MLQLGWKAGTEQYPPDELLDYAIAAEEAGFDSIDVSDHFHPWSERGQACFVWSWLGAVAAKTSKITLGTGVTCPILRYHPAVIAQAAATVGCFAPGRFYLGVGTGEALNEYSAAGQWPDYKIRQAQLAEAIEVAYTDDEEKAIECRKAYWAATFVPALFTQRIYTPKMAEENGKVVGSDTIRKVACISADPEDHIEFARQYTDLGFDQLFFHSAGPDQRGFIEGYGRDVLPQLRQALQPRSRSVAK